jgi:polar amino acid transport system substrate-binding protein
MMLSSEILTDLAPEGVLKAAINFGNPVLAQRGEDGQPAGVSVELAKTLAQALGVEAQFVTFEAAGEVFAALPDNLWNVAFLAIDPVRAAQIDFSSPYVIIEGTYLVPQGSTWQTIAELDRSGVRIAVGQGAAYDLFLSRTLEHAELVRAPTSAAAIEWFIEQQLEAAAGVQQPLEQFAATHTGYRVLPDSFTEIRQAMAVPKGKTQGAHYIQQFIAEQIRKGFVAAALKRSGQQDARVGPVPV